jgi:hypothetical protein
VCTGRSSLKYVTEIITGIFVLMGCCAVLIGSLLPTFRYKISVTSSGFKRSKKTVWSLKMGPMVCPETSLKRWFVLIFRRFGTICRFHIQGPSSLGRLLHYRHAFSVILCREEHVELPVLRCGYVGGRDMSETRVTHCDLLPADLDVYLRKFLKTPTINKRMPYGSF